MKRAKKRLNKFVIFLITVCLFFQFCPVGSKAFALSVEDERILGQKFLINMRKYFDFVEDDFANEYINDLGHYLIRPLETKHFPFRFYIIKDNTLNAFAAPGGHIFIYSGLIEVMHEIDELAAVICHEIGHVSARHLSHRIEQSKMIGLATMAGMLAGIFIGGKAAGALMASSVAAGAQVQLHYSRNDERQADQLGFKYMDKAGFDPAGMISTLKKLQQGQWSGTDRIPPYLLTHPGGPERMSNIEVMLTDYTVKTGNEQTARFREHFPFLKTILRAKYVDSHDAERFFNKELEKNPDSTLAHFGLGIICKERAEYPSAIDHFKKTLKGQSESIPILRNLGEAYQLKGQDGEAIRTLEKALKMDNQDRSALFLLAASYQNLEQYTKAIHIYKRLTLMRPVKDGVFYQLGVSYGRLGRLDFAHYNFGIYFKRLKKIDKAKFHFQKADELSKDGSAIKGRIHKAMEEISSKN